MHEHVVDAPALGRLVAHEHATPFVRGPSGWFRCVKCQTFVSLRGRTCPAGGVHAAMGSRAYADPRVPDPREPLQRCEKCRALIDWRSFRCAAGGLHVVAEEDDFAVAVAWPGARIDLGTLSLALELDKETAVIKVTFLEGKPREFDFARDRHIAAADVEEYVGRRTVELVRNAQKAQPW